MSNYNHEFYSGQAAKPKTLLGVEFRSSLEACWAIMFEAAGFTWLYEPCMFSFQGDDGSYAHYRPDFLIATRAPNKPSTVYVDWIEIKPFMYNPMADSKYLDFSIAARHKLNHGFYMLAGPPWEFAWSMFEKGVPFDQAFNWDEKLRPHLPIADFRTATLMANVEARVWNAKRGVTKPNKSTFNSILAVQNALPNSWYYQTLVEDYQELLSKLRPKNQRSSRSRKGQKAVGTCGPS